MITNLKDLLAEATVDTTNLLPKTVEWSRVGEDGKTVTSTLDVFIVKDVSFASSDRIYLGDNKTQDSSRMARTVAERVRFGAKGEESMTFEQASNLKPTLGWALASAVYEFDKEHNPKVEDEESAKA